MPATAIVSADAPAPAGAYSQALTDGEWVFVAGHGGFDPATGALISDEVEDQLEQTFRNIDALLGEAGCSRRDIVSCLVHLSDLALFPRYNKAYERLFAAEPRPVRTTVGAELTAGMLVEVTVVAKRGVGPVS